MSRGIYHLPQGPVQGSGEPLIDWLGANISLAKQRLVEDGALLLRGFHAPESETAERALAALGGDLLDDAYWSTPRKGVSGKTFTATETPPNRTISLHSEMAYMPSWPRLLAFHSIEVAEQGGATTICNIDEASAELADILGAFAEKGVMYRRYYHTGIDIPWKTAFRTEEPADVEEVAARTGMKVEWLPGNVLMTEHRAQGCIKAEDGRLLWFNQTNLFHPAALAPAARDQLSQLLGADRLPRQSFYGDGSPIAVETIVRVNEVLDRLSYDMDWQPQDLLIVDNLRFLHGRATFQGSRRLLVAMADKESVPQRMPLFATA